MEFRCTDAGPQHGFCGSNNFKHPEGGDLHGVTRIVGPAPANHASPFPLPPCNCSSCWNNTPPLSSRELVPPNPTPSLHSSYHRGNACSQGFNHAGWRSADPLYQSLLSRHPSPHRALAMDYVMTPLHHQPTAAPFHRVSDGNLELFGVSSCGYTSPALHKHTLSTRSTATGAGHLHAAVANEITVYNWFLLRVSGDCSSEVAIGGFLSPKAGDGQKIQTAAIVDRLEECKLVAKDGAVVNLVGVIDDFTTVSNGFPLQIAQLFLSGFPHIWMLLLGIGLPTRGSGASICSRSCDHCGAEATSQISIERGLKGEGVFQAQEIGGQEAQAYTVNEVPVSGNTLELDAHKIAMEVSVVGAMAEHGEAASPHQEKDTVSSLKERDHMKPTISFRNEASLVNHADELSTRDLETSRVHANQIAKDLASQGEEESLEMTKLDKSGVPAKEQAPSASKEKMLEPGFEVNVVADSVLNVNTSSNEADVCAHSESSAGKYRESRFLVNNSELATGDGESVPSHDLPLEKVDNASPVLLEEKHEYTKTGISALKHAKNQTGVGSEAAAPIMGLSTEDTREKKNEETCTRKKVNSKQVKKCFLMSGQYSTKNKVQPSDMKESSAVKQAGPLSKSDENLMTNKRQLCSVKGDSWTNDARKKRAKMLPPPLPPPIVPVSKKTVSTAFGLKTSRSGRLLVPPLAHWRGQGLMRDMDGGIIAIEDGSEDTLKVDTGIFNFKPPAEARAKKLQKWVCAAASKCFTKKLEARKRKKKSKSR